MRSAAPRRAAASTTGPGISIKLSALHPRYSRAQIERVHGRALSAAEGAGRAGARATTSASTSMPRRPTGWRLSLDLLERLCFEPELAGWNGIGFVVQAYQKRCALHDRLADRPGAAQRPSADGAAGQGRLLGQRDQARPARRAGRLSGLHAQDPHRRLLPRLRAQAAGRARRGVPAVRDAQCADAGHDPRASPATTSSRPVRVPVPARHGRAALRGGRRAGDKLDRPCRIYAPVGTHETLLAYLVRRLLENGANTSFVNQIADPDVTLDTLLRRSGRAGAGAAAGRRAASARSRCRATCSARARRIRAGSISPTSRCWRRLRRRCRPACQLARRAGAGRRAARRRSAAGDAIRPTAATWSARSSRRRLSWSMRACAAARRRGRRRRQRARAILRRAADLMEARLEPLLGPIVREAGKTFGNAVGEVREAVDFLRYYAGCVAGLLERHAPAAGRGRLHQPVELPAVDLHRPDRGRAGRRQCGDRQAGRGDAADRRRRPWRCCTRPACRARRCSSCPATARSADGWSAIRRSPAWCSPARPRWRSSINRQLAQRLNADGRPPALIAETGGQNAHGRRFLGLARAARARRR